VLETVGRKANGVAI